MSKRLFVANIPFSAIEEDIVALFEDNGIAVQSARIIYDRDTDRSKGYGFVELQNASDVDKATSLDQQLTMSERRIAIRVAEERPPQRNRAGGSAPRGGREEW